MATRHRTVLDSSVPPSGSLVTLLAFETAADANVLTLRVQFGYGEVECRGRLDAGAEPYL